MPEAIATRWECSRCGAEQTVEGTGQPKDWCRVYFVVPPRGSVNVLAQKVGDLCDPCGGLLVDFVTGKNVEAEMAKAMELAAVEKWATDDLVTQNSKLVGENMRLRTALKDLAYEAEVAAQGGIYNPALAADAHIHADYSRLRATVLERCNDDPGR